MADSKTIGCNVELPRVDFGRAPEAGLADAGEGLRSGGDSQSWAAGFVTSEGAHMPLFVPNKSRPESHSA